MENSWWSMHAPYIRPFDGNHLLYIGIVSLLFIILFCFREQMKSRAKTVGYIILAVSVLQQILLYSWYMIEMGFDVSESLPLHISRITSLFGIYYLITNNRKVILNYSYFQ